MMSCQNLTADSHRSAASEASSSLQLNCDTATSILMGSGWDPSKSFCHPNQSSVALLEVKSWCPLVPEALLPTVMNFSGTFLYKYTVQTVLVFRSL